MPHDFDMWNTREKFFSQNPRKAFWNLRKSRFLEAMNEGIQFWWGATLNPEIIC